MSTSYPNSTLTRIAFSCEQWMTSETTSNHKSNHSLFQTLPLSSSTSMTTSGNPFRTFRPSLRTPIYNDRLTTNTTLSEDDNSSVLMAVVEGRGRAKGMVGLALIDLYNPVLVLSQFNDNSNYESLRIKCNVFHPIEIIVPKSLVEEESRLFDMLCEHLPNAYIKTINRKYFNEDKGHEIIQNLRCDDCSTIDIELKTKYYCLSSSSALINYIEMFEHIIYAPKSLKVVFEGSEQTMVIDPTSAKLLELIVNLNDRKSTQSLFGVINRTKTRSGYRLLRSNLLQPSTDLNLIQTRNDMIEEIVSSETLFQSLESILTQFKAIEIERIISSLVQTLQKESVKVSERKIESIIILKHIILLIEPLVTTLTQTEDTVFHEYIQVLNDRRFGLIMNEINEIIRDSVKYSKGSLSMRLEKCFCIKEGFNTLLDIVRKAYSEAVDDIDSMVDTYRQKYSLKQTLKTSFTTNRGFYMQISSKNVDKMDISLPKEFIRVNVTKNCISFTTQDLINKNNRINATIDEIYLMSNAIVNILIKNILQYIGCLYNLSEVLSKIDLVFSFAYQCSIGGYVRPIFGGHLAIKKGRHPVLEKVLNRKPIPNNTYLSEDNNFMLITGPNMSGKSTHLKQTAIVQVMAQIGSYIPAEFGTFRICDRLFTRIGNNDEIETNSSTFTLEMREMSYILHNITDHSLVIIDELGRGTSIEEGVGLCWSLCEQLIHSKAFTLFVTHFIELTKLENHFFNVSNFHFTVEHSAIEERDCDSYTFTHILEPGVTQELLYGLRLANMTALDPTILSNAQLIAQQLVNIENQSITTEGMNETKRAKYKLTSMLRSLVSDRQIPDKELLYVLKDQYMTEIEGTSQEGQEMDSDFSLT